MNEDVKKRIFSYIPCDLCKSTDAATILSARINVSELQSALPSQTLYHICRCRNCGLIYLNPRLNDETARRLYSEHLSEYISNFRYSPAHKAAYSLYYSLTRRIPLANKGKVLDIGCGIGTYCRYLLDTGWDAVGIEPEKQMYDIAKNVLRIDVHHTLLEDFPCDNGYFDAITLYQLLEHVPSPLSLLKRCRRILKEDGALVIGNVPHFRSVDQRLFGRFNTGLGIPYHTYHFTPETLKRCCEAAGFRHLRTEYELFVPTQISYNLLNYIELTTRRSMRLGAKLLACSAMSPFLFPLYTLCALCGNTFTFKMVLKKTS